MTKNSFVAEVTFNSVDIESLPIELSLDNVALLLMFCTDHLMVN